MSENSIKSKPSPSRPSSKAPARKSSPSKSEAPKTESKPEPKDRVEIRKSESERRARSEQETRKHTDALRGSLGDPSRSRSLSDPRSADGANCIDRAADVAQADVKLSRFLFGWS